MKTVITIVVFAGCLAGCTARNDLPVVPASQTPASAPAPDRATKPLSKDSHGVALGTLADDVLVIRGKALGTEVLGRDDEGLIVEWKYPDVTYVMKHREVDGVRAYRVVEIR